MRTSLTLSFALLALPLFAADPEPLKITLHPQAIESPALKYRLLPTELELKEGNAVPILLRLPWEQNQWMQTVYPTLHVWEDRPLTDPLWKEADNVLPAMFYSEMKRAAFRRHAQWEYPVGEQQQQLYAILLPDVQGLRTFLAPGLSVKIRRHITKGELDQAREGILVGLANSRHLAQTPFFVNQLVATAINRTMLRRVDELVSQPKSPNLYRALSSLPPLAELERAASLEGQAFASMLPAVNDLDRPREAKEWRKMASQLVELLEQLQEISAVKKPAEEAGVVEKFLDALDASGNIHRTTFVKHARAELPQLLKLPEEKVAAMSDEEAGIRWYVYMRLDRDQKSAAVLTLPPREAWPRLAELQLEIKSMREKTGGKGFDFIGAPSVYVAVWTVNRKVAALRILEAVRHYASQHEGRLPERLDDIAGLSIPLDPLTGKPFAWIMDGASATLIAPPLPPEYVEEGSNLHPTAALTYEVQVK